MVVAIDVVVGSEERGKDGRGLEEGNWKEDSKFINACLVSVGSWNAGTGFGWGIEENEEDEEMEEVGREGLGIWVLSSTGGTGTVGMQSGWLNKSKLLLIHYSQKDKRKREEKIPSVWAMISSNLPPKLTINPPLLTCAFNCSCSA